VVNNYMNYAEAMRISLLLIGLLVFPAFAADVYRSVDENGNIIFTDKPTPDAEKIRIDEIQTIDAVDAKPLKSTPKKSEESKFNYGISISSPEDGATLRSNNGDITVSAVVKPARLAPGHRLALYLDGNVAATGGPQFDLTNIDRGTHSAIVAVQGKDGKDIQRSSPVSFTVLRASSQHPPPVVGKPPPPPAP
jgi:hypothetical protein